MVFPHETIHYDVVSPMFGQTYFWDLRAGRSLMRWWEMDKDTRFSCGYISNVGQPVFWGLFASEFIARYHCKMGRFKIHGSKCVCMYVCMYIYIGSWLEYLWLALGPRTYKSHALGKSCWSFLKTLGSMWPCHAMVWPPGYQSGKGHRKHLSSPQLDITTVKSLLKTTGSFTRYKLNDDNFII